MLRLFAWFDRLPLPDVQGRKYVRVWTGVVLTTNTGQRYLDTMDGFLLNDDGKKLRIVRPDWNLAEYERNGNTPDDEYFVGYRELNLINEVTTLASRLGTKEEADGWEYSHSVYFDRLERAGRLLSIARMVALVGKEDLALTLLRKLPASYQVTPESNDDWTDLEEELHENFAELLRWQTMRAFDDKGVTRADLLARYKQIIELCPLSSEAKKIQAEEIPMLERMLKEDVSHPTLSQTQLASLLPAKRAEELVFQLRNDNVPPSSRMDSWPEEDLPPSIASNGAYEQLKRLRFEAVPAVIKALKEDSYTRTVRISTRYGGGGRVVRVNDLSHEILTEIVGFNFYWIVPSDTKDKEAAVHKLIEEWWEEIQEKGEKQTLIDRVSAGGHIQHFAEVLLARYPDAGEEAIIAAVRKSDRTETALIELLQKRNSERSREFFLTEMRENPQLPNRLASARILQSFGDPAAVQEMIRYWESIPSQTLAEFAPPKENAGSFGVPPAGSLEQPLSNLLQFLLSSGNPGAIIAVEKRLPELSVHGKLMAIDAAPVEAVSTNAEADCALADLLISTFADKTVPRRAPIDRKSHGPEPLSSRRVADYSGEALHNLWPDKFPFDVNASPPARDLQLVQIANLRRRERNEPELPLPDVPQLPKLDLPRASNIVAIEWAPESMAPSAELSAKLESLIGAKLTFQSIMAAISSYTSRPDPRARRFELSMYRFTDLTGVRILACLKPGSEPRENIYSWTMIEMGEYSDNDSEHLPHLHEFARPQHWEKMKKAIEAMHIAPPAKNFHFSIQIGDE